MGLFDHFRSDGFGRTNLGLDLVPGGHVLVKWRIADLALVLLQLLAYPLVYRIQPFERQFYVGDLTLLHPFAEHERVTAGELFAYALWAPAAVLAVLALAVSRPKNRVYVAYVTVLGLALSVFSASLVTDLLKNGFGRHRPDFLARCVPKAGTPHNVLVHARDVCTSKNRAVLADGFRTTPSGHLSIAFAGLLYSTLWLGGQLAVTRPQAGAWRWLASFAPTLGAMFIALSRTEDYRHHFVDVFVGSALGVVVAVWLYFRLFPLLAQPRCHEPRLVDDDEGYSPV